MNDFQIAGGLMILIAAAMCVPVLIVGTRPRTIHPPRPDIDARIESALLDGYTTPIFDALVADVCAAAVADVDNEWREVSGA